MTPFTWHYAEGVRPLPPVAWPAAVTDAPVYAGHEPLLVWADGAGRRHAIATTADWARRRAHILANLQKVMGPLPDPAARGALDVRTEDEASVGNLTRRRLTYVPEPGDRVPAYLFLPRGGTARPAILCLHQTTAIGKSEPAGEGGKPNLHYALELAQRGYVTLAPDYPGYGEYACDAYGRGYVSTTMKAVWNHTRALDLLESLPEVDGARLGCIGHSLGGHNALFIGAFDSRLQAVVTSCGFTSFAEYKGGDLTGWSHDGYMPRIATEYGRDAAQMPFDFADVLAAIAPRAVFINAPLGDDFALAGVRTSVQAAQPVYALFGAADGLVALHPDGGHDFPPAVREAAYRFLDRALRHAAR